MHIILKKKYLYFYNYKIKCSIGKKGLTSNKVEGDQKTPKGKFKFILLLYRKDRVVNFQCKIKKRPINKNMGWCDDPVSKYIPSFAEFRVLKMPATRKGTGYATDPLDEPILIKHLLKPGF